jgi:hypothetical protein
MANAYRIFGLLALILCIFRGYQGNMESATFNAVFACFGIIMAKLEEIREEK